MTTCWTSAEVVQEPVPNLPARPSREPTSPQNGAKPEIIRFSPKRSLSRSDRRQGARRTQSLSSVLANNPEPTAAGKFLGGELPRFTPSTAVQRLQHRPADPSADRVKL